jgi:hypothetical protein
MKAWLLAKQAQMMAIQAEIEGMKAENTFKFNTEEYIPYGEDQFQEKAQELYGIYNEIIETRKRVQI